jgi:hypothetical protein
MNDIKIPEGPTQFKWYATGYQAALADLIRELNEGGEQAAREWIKNNRRSTS